MSKSLDNPINWSFKVGSLFGIAVRVHLLFVLGGLVVLFHELGDEGQGFIYGFGSLALLFLIVLVHEFGHCFGARYAGGFADEILMWPLGGLAYTCPPHTARANMITAIAGPLVNVVFLFLTAAVVLAMTGDVGALPLNPLKPFQTTVGYLSETHYWLVTFFTLNYIILLFNLAPVFPLDGGRVLQCILWARMDYQRATLIATGVGMVGAIAIGILGLATKETIFFAIAFFGYFTCWQQRQMLKSGMFDSGNEFGYDFSKGYTSLEGDGQPERKPSLWERRRARKALIREQRESERLLELRRNVDEILAKVHRDGMESLSPKERRILSEESARQRSDG